MYYEWNKKRKKKKEKVETGEYPNRNCRLKQ